MQGSDIYLAWLFARVHVIGTPSTEYISDETPMIAYTNLHLAFEQARIRAKQPNSAVPPPRVLIIGPEHAGRSSAAKILTNYATKVPRLCSPLLVNLDPSDGGWTVPGTLSACAISSPIPTSSPANMFGEAATTAPAALSSSSLLPIVNWFGHSDPKRNQEAYEHTLKNLASSVRERLSSDAITNNSGMIIDTHYSFATSVRVGNEMKYPLVQLAIEEFDVNFIIVIGHEKLNVEMQRLFASFDGRAITIVKVPKAGGVVELDHAYRTRCIAYQIRNYFYGPSIKRPESDSELLQQSVMGGEGAPADQTLSPYSSMIKFSDLRIYRIGAEAMAPSSALPIGAARVLTELQPVKVDPGASFSSGLLNSLLALLPAPPVPKTEDEDTVTDDWILGADAIGFLLISSIDGARQRMTVLSPNPGSISGRVALIGSFEWQDQ